MASLIAFFAGFFGAAAIAVFIGACIHYGMGEE